MHRGGSGGTTTSTPEKLQEGRGIKVEKRIQDKEFGYHDTQESANQEVYLVSFLTLEDINLPKRYFQIWWKEEHKRFINEWNVNDVFTWSTKKYCI
eukprot:UN27345